jgi:hypothetical protein
MYFSKADGFGVLHADFLELFIVGPWRVVALLCLLFTELIPLVKFLEESLLVVLTTELLVVHLSSALYDYGLAVSEAVPGYLFGLLKFEGEVDSRADSTLL